MSRIYIRNGTVVLKDALLQDAHVAIDGEKISSVGRNLPRAVKGALSIDVKGCFITPGFIDTHIHGAPGKIFKNEIKFGTTSIVVTESCASLETLFKKIRRVEEFIDSNPLGKNVLGVRIEGPYISKAKAGAQDKRYIRKPDSLELLKIIGRSYDLLKMMTIAPEVKGAIPLIKLLRRYDIIASMGHTDATYEEALEGISAGIRHATHLYNAMGDGRDGRGGVAAASNSPRVIAEVIVDLVHVDKMLIRGTRPDKLIFITDSVAAEPRGAKKRDGVFKFKDGRIAGSCLTMIGAVRNAVKECGFSLVEAVRMATLNPARLLGLEKRKSDVSAGMDADIVIFDKDFDVKMTMANGKILYRKRGF